MPGYRAVITACLFAASSASMAEPQASKNAIKAHIDFLADDRIEGRETGSRGYDIAASYVAAQFAQHGVAPKGDQGTYLQHVPLRLATAIPDSAVAELISGAGTERLTLGSDFVMGTRVGESPSAKAAPLLFVGYGIRSKAMQHDDYKSADVKGKIVVVLQGYPSRFPSEVGAHLGSAREKVRVAAQLGAAGVVVMWTPKSEKTTPFAALKRNMGFPAMSWTDASGKPEGSFPFMQDSVTVSMDGAKKLFAKADTKLEDIYAAAEANQPLPQVDLKQSLRASQGATRRDTRSSNVVGMIPGSDPLLKNEYVVFSAHLDHLGIVPEKSGDNIYNGAMDNASGVAILIEMARMFNALPVKPKRSVLFIALTGEEKGLLGSDYFASNPTVPQKDIVANVNLDMPLLNYDFSSVVAMGAEHSSLNTAVTNAVKKVGVTVGPDPWPEQAIFVRSDHYSFVRQGIPSIMLVTGQTSFSKEENAAQQWGDFFAKRYHKPNDDLSQPFNFDAAIRFAKVNYNLALEVANAKDRPVWNQGDFFGDTFRK
ncbi:M28 family metallopeptidase [Pseudoduganella sp. OTU4001]|uniref:M28 family metallopeptidase n=1 Tax=Pseudoduganella sp. OTU4001 TaxID=3043854 RepID=UPI00313B0B32